MRRAFALVEGQTEESFVERDVRPHLRAFDVDLIPIVVTTKRTPVVKMKGGISRWSKVARDIDLLLGDSNVIVVTTMIDYYGLPSDTPGLGTAPPDPLGAVQHIEEAIAASHADARLDPFIVLHELEALLYADPRIVGTTLGSKPLERMMREAVEAAGGPELVDDSPATAPSKRIRAAFPGYVKTADGPALLSAIGLARLRAACPRFGAWLGRMESL